MKLPEIAPQDGDANPHTSSSAQTASFVPYITGTEAAMPEKKRSLKPLWITLVVILALLIAAYVGFALYFMNHFSFNTTLNGIDVTLQTAAEVERHIADDLESYTLQIEGRDSNAVVKGSDINLRYIEDGHIDTILANQNEWLWPLSLIPSFNTEYEHANVEFDEDKLTTVLAALPLLDETQMQAPVDAHLAFEGNAYVIAPGSKGTTLDKEKTMRAIRDAIDAGLTTINLEEEELYIEPTIGADDPTLVANRDTFNTYVPFQIIYTLGDRREVLDGTTTMNWVTNTEGAGPYALNEEAVRAWVADFASRYDTLGATRTIVNGFGEEKQVTGGTYGWLIDQEAEVAAIMNAFAGRIGEERQPYLSGWAASLGAQDWGTTYLEVDLTAQHMWYYVDGQVVLETDVVTGNPNTGYATPEGVYYIFSKTMHVVTRGDRLPDGSYEWEVPVTYWMPFTYSGCGFHDADWQPYFGGTRYLTNGSHGCINMPPYLAAELYDMLEPETPVITHY